ncbi:glutaredoxin family protein [Enterobacteriaceae endosymbiont of Macroplea appendiculata]|uniref:glutaredoxin family protein n=1 Tax=Enterobacteriaceae endosymbiont of Macroplea appendiculata TaxID=2675790 RepID=UPI001449EC32|nr:glutaredoxin domain-containing protein [Enterobacteriaceae endosymbiont of Macroplea appendiculata]QJC30738.1 hypothetical protein GJT86_00570 [Enterobacteriaceae endosymbiont of Macroplea appendiculata]
MNILAQIKQQIIDNPIILYMKGTITHPQCGYSDKTAKIILTYNVKCTYINILDDDNLRKFLPKYANWPTFPQLWVNNTLIGGYDIIFHLHINNKLLDILNKNVHDI